MPKTVSSKTIVWVEPIADVLVAVVKSIAAFFTGSAAIAAEGVHKAPEIKLEARIRAKQPGGDRSVCQTPEPFQF